MQLITAKCPDCGADLKIPEGIHSVTCEYCGSQILLSDLPGTGLETTIRSNEINEPLINNPMIQPAAQPQYASNVQKKSGCAVGVIAAIMLLVIGGAAVLFFVISSKPTMVKSTDPTPQVQTKQQIQTQQPTQFKPAYSMVKYADYEGRKYYSIYADITSDEEIRNVCAVFIRDYQNNKYPYTVNIFREKEDAQKNGFPQVKHNESWIIKNAESIGLVAKLEFGNPKSEIEIVKYVNGKSVEVN